MQNKPNNMDAVLAEIDKNGQKITDVNILFLDVSSTCTGYSIFNLDFGLKHAKLTKAGALWLDTNWTHAEKYSYIFHALVNYFWIIEKIDYIVVEQYSINPKKMAGVHVVPEMMGVIKVAANENGVKVDSILPQSWRKLLGIKKENDDWKIPTKKKILEYAPHIPEESVSNITNNLRRTPFDVYDAIAVGIGWLDRTGFSKIDCKLAEFNTHLGYQLGE